MISFFRMDAAGSHSGNRRLEKKRITSPAGRDSYKRNTQVRLGPPEEKKEKSDSDIDDLDSDFIEF
jgi:hypothetical protein